ncbi:DUF202 domain-containing protein [Geodermatophilus sp. SYSU D00703]
MRGARDGVFDAGLQAERTALAWRRTALALAVGAVGAGRLAAPVVGAVAVGLAGLGLVQAVSVAATAQRRYRTVHRSLTARGDLTAVRAAGLPIAALTLSAVTVGLLALAFVLDPGG